MLFPERSSSISRYMVLCKVMNNNEDEVSNILSAKLSIKFSGVEIEAMKVVTPIGSKKIHYLWTNYQNV